MAENIHTQLTFPFVIEKNKLASWNATLKIIRDSPLRTNIFTARIRPELSQILEALTNSRGFVFSNDITKTEKEEFIRLAGQLLVVRAAAAHDANKDLRIRINIAKHSELSTSPRLLNRFFGWMELASRILPYRVRLEAFEPSYNDAKSDFLKARQRFKGKFQRKFLVVSFVSNVGLLIVQSAWGMCSAKVKGAILWVVPEILRRFFRF
jgi:hypothetical protein